MNELTYEDVELAYRKLKHVIYWDTTYSFLRGQIAQFEQQNDLKTVFKNITKAISESKIDYFINYSTSISFWELPKKVKLESLYDKEEGIITNLTDTELIIVSRDFKFINADIRLHIISVLWILKGGFNLELDMTIKPLGNRLRINSDKTAIVRGLPLFHRYHILYKKWRDNAFTKAREVIADKKNALILSLDVMNYYPSIQFNFEQISEIIPQNDTVIFLNRILKLIHFNYATKIKNSSTTGSPIGLPIGLQSSAVIANWYLDKFDKQVMEEINPIYYARYVDDILLVLSNPKIDENKKNDNTQDHDKQGLKSRILNRYFVEHGIFDRVEENAKVFYSFTITNNVLRIQEDKLRIFFFDYNQPTALLDKIERELKIESSEFRLLPEQQIINFDFFADSHFLSLTGSANKIRHVSDFGINHLGTSNNISKNILFALQSERIPNPQVAQQILMFFNGARAIESARLWEKAITYFVATKDKLGLFNFLKNIKTAIENIEFKLDEKEPRDEDKTQRMKLVLNKLLIGSTSMALALDTTFLTELQNTQKNEPTI